MAARSLRTLARVFFRSFLVIALATSTLTWSSPARGGPAEPVGTVQQPLTGTSGSFWPSPIIPVCWDTWNDGDATAREWTRAGASEWERLSAIRFVGWGPCANFPQRGEAVRIRVADERPRGFIGTEGRGSPGGVTMNFTFRATFTDCAPETPRAGGKLSREYCIRLIATHEFGHVLGFTHEDWRSDRVGCPEPWRAQGPQGNYRITSFDVHSVMNYCNPAWIGDGKLSFFDRWGAMTVYGGWSPDFAIAPEGASAQGGMSQLATASRGPLDLHVFYQGPDGAIATSFSNPKFENGRWHRPFLISPPGKARPNTPISVLLRENVLLAYFVQANGAVALTWSLSDPWTEPQPITVFNEAREDSPLVAVLRNQQIHIFYIDRNGGIRSVWANRPEGPSYREVQVAPPGSVAGPGRRLSSDRTLGSNLQPTVRVPGSRLAVVLRKQELHVFFQREDGALMTTWSVDRPWATPFAITPPGAAMAGTSISAVVRAGDQLHVFYQGPDGAIATNWAVGPWTTPFPVTPPRSAIATTPIVALARAAHKLDVHYIGPDRAVATAWVNANHDGGRWQTPFPVTPPRQAHTNSSLAAIARVPQAMDLFFLGPEGQVRTLWENDPRGSR
jgi:hypothetical protein